MPKALSEQAVTQFHDHGWLSPVPVFSRQETERYQRKFAEWETRNGGPVGGAAAQQITSVSQLAR